MFKVTVIVLRHPGYGEDCPIFLLTRRAANIFRGCASPACASFTESTVVPSLLICDHSAGDREEVTDIAGESCGCA